MKKLLSALFVLALCSSVALATVPDPTKCTVVPADALLGVILCPDTPTVPSSTIYTVTVKNSAGAVIPNANVAFQFPLPTNIKECTTNVLTGTTNGSGVCVITLRGGGCQRTSGAVFACQVVANGVIIRSYYNAKSPDWDGAVSNGTVNLADLITFKGPIGCHDYNNDNVMNLADTIVFAGGYQPQHTCTLKP